MTVNKDRVELLCQALESGRYIQCRNRLRRTPLGLVQRWSYCALGVAIDVAVQNGLQVTFNEIENWYYLCGDLPREVQEWYGFEDFNPDIVLDGDELPIATANDDGADFWTISQAIRARYLKDPDA